MFAGTFVSLNREFAQTLMEAPAAPNLCPKVNVGRVQDVLALIDFSSGSTRLDLELLSLGLLELEVFHRCSTNGKSARPWLQVRMIVSLLLRLVQ